MRRTRVVVLAASAGLMLMPLLVAARPSGGETALKAQRGTAHADAVYAASAPASQPGAAGAPAARRRGRPSPRPVAGGSQDWLVGFDKESLDPSQADIASGNFHLGGYGLLPTRASTGPLVDGDGTVEHIYARAVAVSNRRHQTLLLAALENQGTFAAYKQGPYGISDIRAQVAHDTGVPVDMIVVNSDHSHAGPDLIGLWGGVPVDYLKYVHDQTVRALDQAYFSRVRASLLVGTSTPVMPTPGVGGYLPGTATPGEDLVHSQFNKDTQTGYDDSAVDTQLRVLQAYDVSGRPLGTLINYAAHATVMGGGNLRYSADWPGRAARATEQNLGEPVAVTMVADVGRSQPPRPHSDATCGQAGHVSCDVDALDTYTRVIAPWVVDAVSHAVPVQGSNISGQEVFTREVATNPALLGVTYTGEAPVRGYGAYRSSTPPYVVGTVIGTFASAHRLGDILLTANPGEAYPDIRFGVSREVKAPQAFFTFGLANDQLGYLIAPASEYGWISYSQPGNDNGFFNVSAQYGDHLMCTESNLAHALGFAATGDPAPYGANAVAPVCPALTASDGVPMGPAPQQPWAFGDGAKLPPPFPQ
ncbi:MAG: hypothetical protein ABR573_09715 [Candidatus Dormibacteria bacterium]